MESSCPACTVCWILYWAFNSSCQCQAPPDLLCQYPIPFDSWWQLRDYTQQYPVGSSIVWWMPSGHLQDVLWGLLRHRPVWGWCHCLCTAASQCHLAKWRWTCHKRLEVAKEHARACDHWKFEAEQDPVPIPSLQMSDVPLPSPQHPSGPMVSDDKSSCSSESSDADDDSFVSSAVNDTFLLRQVIFVSDPVNKMRELLLVVHAKTKGWGKKGICTCYTRSLD